MDWFSWLSKSGLDASLVYEYGLAFSHNELEEEDIAYFNHEFLQSMGISIAKHRLEILKLARKDRGGPRSVSRLLFAIKKTKRCFSRYIRALIRREEESSSSALVVVPHRGPSPRWRGGMLLKRNKRAVMMSGRSPLLLTNGSSPWVMMAGGGPRIDSFSLSPLVYDYGGKTKEDQEYWPPEEIRWDCMFQDLKPT